MKFIRSFVFVSLVATTAMAGSVVDMLDVDGVRYEAVKFGPANQGKVVLYHSHGVTTVPITSLPSEYQDRFSVASKPATMPAVTKAENDFLPIPREVTPSRTTQPVVAVNNISRPSSSDPNAILEAMRTKRTESTVNSSGNNDWASYNHERGSWVVLDGAMVEKSTLTSLTGFLAREQATINDGSRTIAGAAFDMAERKNNTDNVPTAMELRPALWRRTDERVFLQNYKPTTVAGAMLRIYGVELDQFGGWRIFKVGIDPSFEDWKRLPH